MILATAIAIYFAILKFIKDAMIHHNSFKRRGWSKFWWAETSSQPKKHLFHQYLPMFYDAWHLCEFLQVSLISFLAATFVPDCSIIQYLAIGTILTFTTSLVFSVLYEAIDKHHL
jgi:hypothetical protein